ncbi:MAG TPA: hypothetical protein VN416_07625 [Desulfomonilia bacterium]|jgi:hypothetical protein|nr:hypothetical protein [Desulfomonilia bacterium]
MNGPMKILMWSGILAVLIVIVSLISFALDSISPGHGLVHYYARLGIEVDFAAIIIAVGLIPVVWFVGFIIRTWSVK